MRLETPEGERRGAVPDFAVRADVVAVRANVVAVLAYVVGERGGVGGGSNGVSGEGISVGGDGSIVGGEERSVGDGGGVGGRRVLEGGRRKFEGGRRRLKGVIARSGCVWRRLFRAEGNGRWVGEMTELRVEPPARADEARRASGIGDLEGRDADGHVARASGTLEEKEGGA